MISGKSEFLTLYESKTICAQGECHLEKEACLGAKAQEKGQVCLMSHPELVRQANLKINV